MKVLAPNPECICASHEVPGTVDYTLRILSDYNIPCNIQIRAICHCVRAVEIEAIETITIFGSKPIYRPLPIVERRPVNAPGLPVTAPR